MHARRLLQRLDRLDEVGGTSWRSRARVAQDAQTYEWSVDIHGQLYQYSASRQPSGAWEVTFWLGSRRDPNYRNYRLTKSGHATSVKVISALFAFLQRFLRVKKPPALTFSAEERSRQVLYDRLVRKLVASIPGASWDSSWGDTGEVHWDPEWDAYVSRNARKVYRVYLRPEAAEFMRSNDEE